MLFGLYQGLVKFTGATTLDLHKACITGKLAEFIVESFERMISQKRFSSGQYYPWFLKISVSIYAIFSMFVFD